MLFGVLWGEHFVQSPSMPVSQARAAAFDILLRVERESAFASDLLHSATYAHLPAQDHALATRLVMGVLRWRSRLDHEIAPASSQPPAKLDLEVLIALRLALFQFHWLSRVPTRAALHESVELVKRARKRSAAPFVNAVLRKLSENWRPPVNSEVKSPTPELLSAELAHPRWLVDRWILHYGLEVSQRICEYDQSIPTTSIRLRTPDAEAELQAEGISLAPGNLLASARRVAAGDITKSRVLRERRAVIQDEGSQLVAALVGSGKIILDCCAAPGGKTLAIADQNSSANITAVEIHPHRARLLRNLLGTHAGSSPAIKIEIADVASLPASNSFDRVLADVPCSGTGTLARNPEIKWRLKPEDLADLQQRQVTILRSAMRQVAPGGRLIYSTCSLEKEENEDVIEQILAEHDDFTIMNCQDESERLQAAGELTWAAPTSLTSGPYLRTLPGVHPCDGFFAAVLQKS